VSVTNHSQSFGPATKFAKPFFASSRAKDIAACAALRSSRTAIRPALHQRRHEPVQGRLPWLEKREYDKATSAQKCVRAGGKHNDLENVGFTKRHHTFSRCSAIFPSATTSRKKPSLRMGADYSPEWFAIPKDKLYVTIFGARKSPRHKARRR